MDGFNQIVTQAKQFWATRTANQRIFLGVGAAAMVGLLALFANLMTAPDYKPLMTGLDSADAQAISTELTAKKIPFQLSPDGKSINVPADQLDAARLDVASTQTTHSGRMGFEIFDKVSWGQTEFDEKVNYQRALEGELERTITTLGGREECESSLGNGYGVRLYRPGAQRKGFRNSQAWPRWAISRRDDLHPASCFWSCRWAQAIRCLDHRRGF